MKNNKQPNAQWAVNALALHRQRRITCQQPNQENGMTTARVLARNEDDVVSLYASDGEQRDVDEDVLLLTEQNKLFTDKPESEILKNLANELG